MSERLKEIKTDVESMYNAFNRDDIDGFLDVAENFIDNGYFEHLIEQAEKFAKVKRIFEEGGEAWLDYAEDVIFGWEEPK